MKHFLHMLSIVVMWTLLSSHAAYAEFVQQGSKLVGTGAAGAQYQGTSVALSGDGKTAIVAGNAQTWVWTSIGGVWTQQSKLADSGVTVALSDDGNTAIVGTDAGALVWTRTGAAWIRQGPKLVGSGAVGNAQQGVSVSLSADGDTAMVGGPSDNNGIGAAWVWRRSGGVWTQQGPKLVGSGAIGNAQQGISVCISKDGDTALVGGASDNNGIGAAWVWRRSGGVWSEQGNKLVGSGAVSGFFAVQQGSSVALSADGNTAIVGGPQDNNAIGAAWVWTRVGGDWKQQSPKLVGSGTQGTMVQGSSVSLSADGNTAIVGAPGCFRIPGSATTQCNGDGYSGSAWIWTRKNGIWTESADKLAGSSAVGYASRGSSVALSADGKTAIVGGKGDNDNVGAAWVFVIPSLAVGSPVVTPARTSVGRTYFKIRGTFTEPSGIAGTPFAAVVNWGDDTSDAGTVSGSGSPFTYAFDGTHAYSQAGPYNITVTVSGGSQHVAVTSTPKTISVGVQFAQQGRKLVGTGAVGNFGDSQGRSVSLSADGYTAIVGAPDSNNGVGAAAIWVKSGDTWTEQALLLASDAIGTAMQGKSVALSADGNTALIGAPNDNDKGPYTDDSLGAAWVWTRNAGVWTQQAKLVSFDAFGVGSQQGFSVSLSADGNTAIVGGPIDNDYAGAAWVWARSGSVWTQQVKLTGSGQVGNAQQGFSVSLSGDGETAIVGGSSDNSNAGAAWIWKRSGPVWTQQGDKLVGSGAAGTAFQGYSVSLSGDGNTAIVGGPGDNGNAGAAWAWSRSGGVWTQSGTKLVGLGAGATAQQGFAVAVSLDGSTAIVGGNQDSNAMGAAWVWTKKAGGWTEQGAKLVSSDAVWIFGVGQGASVALSADGNTALVGGPSDNFYGGACWVWIRTAGSWTQQGTKLVHLPLVGIAHQGRSVALSGDGTTAIVGGPFDNNGVGAAWVWTRSGVGWSQEGTKLVGSGSVCATFCVQQGTSVALSEDGNTAIVGGSQNDNAVGAAWVWTRNGGLWTEQAKLVAFDAVGRSSQGGSVALSADGDTAIVGGSGDSYQLGAAWIWTRSGNVWTQQAKLVGSGAISNANQGSSVALSSDGNTAIVGGVWDNTAHGAVWIWTRSAGVWTQQGQKIVAEGDTSLQGGSVSVSADGNTALIGGFSRRSGSQPARAAWAWTKSGDVWTQQGQELIASDRLPGPCCGGGEPSVSLSGDGNTAIIGSLTDNNYMGAAWIWTRSGGIWTRQGSKLVASDATGVPAQGGSVCLSAGAETAIVGGYRDNGSIGAAWVFVQTGERRRAVRH